MNLHGIIEPNYEVDARSSPIHALWKWIKRRRAFLLAVVLPTLMTAAYLYLIVSDQYVSTAHFLVRKAGQESTPGIGVSQALGMATGMASAQSEAMSVSDFLTSHDAVATLRKNDHLVERYDRANVDPFSRLHTHDLTPESLLKYYQRQVEVKYDTETGITTLEVRSFTPQDSFDLVRKLLALGEQRVNFLNQRSYADAIATSEDQLRAAESDLTKIQLQMTHYRQSRSDIDPQASGAARITLVSNLTGQLATAKAQLSAMGNSIDHSSPQYRALAMHVAAVQAQISSLSAQLTGSDDAIVQDIGGYEELKVRQEFLEKRYDSAATSLEKARADAARQQLYVVRVVEANMPVKSTYPQRMRILVTVTISLLLAYAIGWLIVAGVREHAA